MKSKPRELRFLETVQSLLERRLPYLQGRAERTEFIATALAQAIGVGGDHLAMLSLTARFHDVGLIGVPDAVLMAPRSLSPQEREIVGRHIQMGCQLLNVTFFDCPEVLETVWFSPRATGRPGAAAAER